VRLNVRIIAVDRPGMGLSTFQKGRRILDFPEDVSNLADSLNVESFAIMGMSGGGPYLLACAHRLPQRVAVAGIISGSGPDKPGTVEDDIVFSTRLTEWLSRTAPWLMRVLFVLITVRLRRRRELFFWKSLPGPDKAALDIFSIANTWIDSILEAFHFGTKGPVKDLGLLKQPWGFDPGEIRVPVLFWHGQLDRNVSPVAARLLAERIPNCKAYFYPREGHLSLWVNHMEKILDTMVSRSHEYTDANAHDLVTSA
jgi:pimeloyl-ACP methyl ester carboxylesterase